MSIVCRNSFIFIFLLLLTGTGMYAQEPSPASVSETTENIENANSYLDSKTASLDKYLSRSEKIQQRLLKRLQRKEQKMLKKLAAKDSALYYQYLQQQGLSYDSIAALSNDTAYRNKFALQKNSTIDSLRGVQNFIQKQEDKLNAASGIAGKAGIASPAVSTNSTTGNLSGLQQNLNVQQNIDGLIQQKTQSLKSFAAQHTDIKGLEGIQKDVYYAREKIKNWRELAEEPDDAEAKALEYLQGTEGFDKFLKQDNNAFGGLGSNATAADLQRMGYQTKASVNAMLQKSLGNNMSAVQQQMSQQVQQYSEKLNGITDKVNDVKGSIHEAKQGLQSAKDAKKDLSQNLKGEDFKVNPEKGKPFWQRLEWQYNFQTARASVDNGKPATMDLGVNVGYKQNERLSFGIGLGSSIGLGQNWQHIKLSYEGISARAYADWKWIYGFSFQAGYERSFIPAGRAYLPENETSGNPANPPAANTDNVLKNAFGGQQQTAYLGIMKRYKINSNWNGTFLAGYNFLWQQEGQRSPWLLRFGWGK
ncbi:hypothetical protein F0919_02400 [Taibaiella lutea]|uniref:Autotransporter domain-containing protein n=1 Tax=Taibaiella lutea TaxID=2608001 RepID=A0A5M6CTP7_9BACT|nr:hypothetical protein [Taibaiella lutea]KAA5536539.1 hypothetical protein F0919_02400 [Taibaiella lutea]